MSVQLVKFFEEAYEEETRIRFWVKGINDDDNNGYPLTMYVKDVFISPDGGLEGLGLWADLDDGTWEYYPWNSIVKFGYGDRDQIKELQ